ncbi:MAG TPA: prolipoprotein diacylglyceryl transferase [Firmicutes bacterium]|nr:prolipoprotein diacylglyceryl transferase [Bacillota bacterium]
MRPILFHLGTIPIYSYGFTLAVAFIIGVWAVGRRAQKRSITVFDRVVDLALWVLVGALVGSRILFVLLELPTYLKNPVSILFFNQGGLSFYGGVLGGFACGLIYAKRKALPVWPLADLAAPWIALGYSIVRIGCFLNGCCYGVPANVPWALSCAAGDSLLRHPTQLYALGASLAIFLVLLWLERCKPFDSLVFWSYIGLYSIARFVIEIFRESQILAFGWLRTTQVGCLVLLLLAGWMIYRGYRKQGQVQSIGGEETFSSNK